MTLKRILCDSHIEIDVNLQWVSRRDPEYYAARLQEAANDIKEFVRDHRSMDIHDVRVVGEYEYKCEHCGYITEKDDKRPECCKEAILEWATPEEFVRIWGEE